MTSTWFIMISRTLLFLRDARMVFHHGFKLEAKFRVKRDSIGYIYYTQDSLGTNSPDVSSRIWQYAAS